MPKSKLDIQRKYPEHFRALGFDLPADATSTRWHQPVLTCQHEFCLLTLDDILRDSMDITLELVPSHSCTIYLYDRQSRMLNTKASTNSKRQLDVKFAPGMGIVGRCFSRKVAVHLEKPGENSLFEAKSDGRQNKAAESMLCIPLVIHERAVGLFQLVNRVVEKKDKLKDLDRYMEGFDNLSMNVIEHLGDTHNENAFHSRDITTLMEYASLVAESIAQALCRQEAKDPAKDKGNSAMDLLNMLNGKLTTNYDFDVPDLSPDRKPSTCLEPTRRPSSKSPSKSKYAPKARSVLSLPLSPTSIKERLVQAAIKCQAHGRGWLVRKHHPLARLRLERLAHHEVQRMRALRIQKTYRGRLGRVRVQRIRTARSVIADAVFQYAQRKKNSTVKRKVGSPRTRKLWAQTSSTLLTERTKLKNKKVTNIQKLFRGNKARAEVKQQFGVSNPAKMYRSFVKLQARFKGRLVRKLIQKHTVLQHKATKTAIPPFGAVRMRCHNAEPREQSMAYPRCHTGVNQYLVAKRGQIQDLGPLFDRFRLHQEVPPPRSLHALQLPRVRPPRPQDDEPDVAIAFNTRRLVAAHSLSTNVPLPLLTCQGPKSHSKPHDASQKLRQTYHTDVMPHRRQSTVARYPVKGHHVEPGANQDAHMYGIHHYREYRTRAYTTAVGAPAIPAPPSQSRQPSRHRPFLCLVQHTEDAKREGIRKALEELKSYYRSRVVPGPVHRRKSIKEVMDECTKLATTKSTTILVHRVKTTPGVDFNATLLTPEIPEEPVTEMDSVDSLALEYRPVTPMLEAIRLVPPEPPVIPTTSRLDCIFGDSSTSAPACPS
ncbi:hypothetical protein, variant [Aphanomyces invadans]|uniref:GAF domain-containing protein n=1 Tax=Aphanomyces invadans TaxID=157072 RepID=A0A024UIQ3_9STRA|nr:hypothetical protein, variant [Aphanomyces invadans]ETW05747.1 hypothetical protein, variant [Aphanomyces invadans]|eukprot:XP_008865524.1 hypothetical protein, variant [Aphanomyces invadans]